MASIRGEPAGEARLTPARPILETGHPAAAKPLQAILLSLIPLDAQDDLVREDDLGRYVDPRRDDAVGEPGSVADPRPVPDDRGAQGAPLPEPHLLADHGGLQRALRADRHAPSDQHRWLQARVLREHRAVEID